jgi:hypothetical protein
MPTYIIEREIPGIGSWSAEQRQAVSRKSLAVLRALGSEIQWRESYVTGDKLYCVYIAPNEQLIRAHAERGRFPANRIAEIGNTLDPTTAEG